MKTQVQRETFIALRARREGHRIASEVLNPPLQVPPVPVPVAPLPPDEVMYEPVEVIYAPLYEVVQVPYAPRKQDVIAIILGLLIPVIFMAILILLTR